MTAHSKDQQPGELQLVGPAPGQQPPAPMSTQRKARKQALDLLFEAELMGVDVADHLARYVADPDTPPLRELGHAVVVAFAEHADEVDAALIAHLTGRWTLPRMPRIDRSLARMAVAEIRYVGTPGKVAISEAVALAEIYSTDDSASFLNGVLGRVLADTPGETPEN